MTKSLIEKLYASLGIKLPNDDAIISDNEKVIIASINPLAAMINNQ